MTLTVILACCSGAASAAPRVTAVALFQGKAVLSIDGRQRAMREGETSAEGVTLVRADAEGAVIRVDGAEFTVSLDTRISGTLSAASAGPVVRLVQGRGGHYFVDGQINGNPVRFLVDTGATSVTINKHVARSVGVDYRVDGDRTVVETASGRAYGYRVVFDEVKAQSLGLRRVSGVVVDGDAPAEALLGQSFLNRLDIRSKGQVLELRGR
ncbi:MAG: TIGR02281 family clan AA aspartic protease [Gammaproteobacteria bacterium]